MSIHVVMRKKHFGWAFLVGKLQAIYIKEIEDRFAPRIGPVIKRVYPKSLNSFLQSELLAQAYRFIITQFHSILLQLSLALFTSMLIVQLTIIPLLAFHSRDLLQFAITYFLSALLRLFFFPLSMPFHLPTFRSSI